MSLKSLLFALALLVSGPSMAACTETFELGVMGPPALRGFGNSFDSVQQFEDCYNFELGSAANGAGLTLELDASWARDINLTSIALSGGSLAQSLTDLTAGSFSFSNLAAGVYQFVITGEVTGRNGGFLGGGWVGYVGAFATTAAPITAPVPEPGTYAMLALGLLAVGLTLRRRNQI